MEIDNHLREGGDIFASDMEQPELISRIVESFENSTVFLTGGTGFIGKLFLEKLLRVCKTVKVIILIRPKKGKDRATRFQEIFEGPNMVPLKLANPKFPHQVRLVHGDCIEKDLGLAAEDKRMLIEEVNYIIHCAASVRFDEELRTAAYINVRATKDLIAMGESMKNLRAFLYVSTAYSHCPRKVIDEEFYKAAMNGDDLLHLVESMDDDRLKSIKTGLIKDWPNTYVFTKAIAEDVVKSHRDKLPIAVLRPSIVIASKAEPLAGWIDNFYGATGIFLAVGLGFLRVLLGKKENKADMIPADCVVNAGIAVLWDLARKRSLNENSVTIEDTTEQVPVFNAVSSPETPITWGEFAEMTSREGLKIPTKMMLWYPVKCFVSNPFLCGILAFFVQTIPAYLVDVLCLCLGKEQRLVKGYQKVNKFANVIFYFTQNEWKFGNKNLQALWQRLEPEDQRLFPFSMKNFQWKNFIYFYIRGIRVYLLKDPLETLPKAKTKLKILLFFHFLVLALLIVLNLSLVYYVFKFLFNKM